LYEDVSSPTVSITSVLTIAAIAAEERRYRVTVDIESAYLNAKMPRKKGLFMRLDPLQTAIYLMLVPEYESYRNEDGTLVVELLRALYGCIESAVLWYQDLSQGLRNDGFVENRKDPCVLNKGTGEDQITVCIYVDDLFITSKNMESIESTLAQLKKRYGNITVKKSDHLPYLGMMMDFTENGQVTISMDSFTKEITEGHSQNKKVNSPATEQLLHIGESEQLDDIQRRSFHTITAKLLYLAKRVRPDILLPVSYLCSRAIQPNRDDQKKLVRCLDYLSGTRHLGLCLRIKNVKKIESFIDAAYANHTDMKSHSAVVITCGGGAIYAKSSKQKLVSKSSTEAELIALANGIVQTIWLRDFLCEQGYDMEPATIYQDNKSTIALAEKGRAINENSKHINVRYFFVKDRIEKGEIKIEYLPTSQMIADMLTKPLQGNVFRTLRNLVLNISDDRLELQGCVGDAAIPTLDDRLKERN